MMQPSDNGNNSHKTENVEATPIAENEPTAGTRQQHTFKSILKSRLHEPGSQSFNKPNTNISWQDFHGQELTIVHEYVQGTSTLSRAGRVYLGRLVPASSSSAADADQPG